MNVAIIKDDKLDYDHDAPFNPAKNYPEYPFKDISQKNAVYDSIRKIFFMFGMDKENFGKPLWNPLGDIIKPGDNVLIKPNFVRNPEHLKNNYSITTHGSIIRSVLDYIYIALNGKGCITIGDSPPLDSNFEKTIQFTGLENIIDFYNDYSTMKINLIDFRIDPIEKEIKGTLRNKIVVGDPLGCTSIDLGKESKLIEIIDDYEKFRAPNYNKNEMIRHHNKKVNEYNIANTVLNADVIINIPKLKTHNRAGITCALKNMVGINGTKAWLPHYRIGSLTEGGDEYLNKSIRKNIISKLTDEINSKTQFTYNKLCEIIIFFLTNSTYIFPYNDQYNVGGWYGNDTIPRTIIDLNMIISYANKHGILEKEIQRKIFTIVDGIVAGENEGPTTPTPKHCGILVAGDNSVAIDLVCSRIMGFDYNKIPTFKHALNTKKYILLHEKPENINIMSDYCNKFNDIYNKLTCNLIPTSGWINHIEYRKTMI
jgi:uncharacterized protein (DUF362 family)